jgi:Trk-type K+ transport systems, membrane components
MLLIIIGGIGYLVWADIYKNKWRINKYGTQSKAVLIATSLLILLPALYFVFFEFSDMPAGERIAASFFQSVTTRTAGFNTVNLGDMSEIGKTIMIGLMLIGGSPGSTAGGMKTTTLVVLLSCVISQFRRKDSVEMLKRRIDDDTVKKALTIFLMYITLFLFGGIIISAVEDLPILTCLFETASAIGTVGLTLGITPSLCVFSKIILIFLMYFGRVGGLTLIYAAMGGKKSQLYRLPIDKIMVG